MKDLCIFLNTRIENAGLLAGAGDLCLSPVRYWCNGHTVRAAMVRLGDPQRIQVEGYRVDHVRSFHPDGHLNVSRTNEHLQSSETGMFKAIFAIVLFVPGLFLGIILKTFAYLHADMRERHDLVKRHYTPIVRQIGTDDEPIGTEEELIAALDAEFANTPLHRPTDAIIIRGNRHLEINREPGLLGRFNPMKLILVRAGISDAHRADGVSLEDAMFLSGKWEHMDLHMPEGEGFIAHALADPLPRRLGFTCKHMHRLYYTGLQEAEAVAYEPAPLPPNPDSGSGAAVAVAHA